MELSKIQKEVYNSNDNLLVTAGAGSGKTRVLVEKYISVFEDFNEAGHPLKIDQVVAITFTDKAAREMKERVSEELSKKKGEFYTKIKRELPFARISTIHAFCSRILRESALYTSGLDPDFKIVSGISAARRISKLVDSYMIRNISKIKGFFKQDSTITFQKLRDWMKEGIAKRWNEDFIPQDIDEKVASLYKDCIKSLVEEYKEVSVEESVVDFEDLLIFTKELLEKNEELRKRYADYFVYIFVDEFQDTNVLQSQIIDLLHTHASKIWYVGDPKQSIYAFRGADVKVFLNIEKRSENRGISVRELQENFRSSPNLVEFYNKLFSKVFLDGPIRYSKQIRRSEEDEEKHVWLLENGFVGKMEESRVAEANTIARLITNLSSLGRPFSDITILLKVMTNVSFIEKAFLNHGIPYHLVGGKNFFNRVEVNALENLVSVVVDPYNDRAMTGLLLSPFFNMSLDEVLLLKRHGAKLYDVMKENKKYVAVLSLVDDLMKLKNTIDVSKMIEIAIGKTDYLGKISRSEDGDKRVANVVKFLENIESLDIPPWDVDSLRRVMEASQGEMEEEASVLSERENVVKIMTVHKAKGLEFPVTILAQMGSGRNYVDERDLQESKRLLYVAMTRAKDFLILSKENGRKSESKPWITLLKENGFIDENGFWQIPKNMNDVVKLISKDEIPLKEVVVEKKEFDFDERYLKTPQFEPQKCVYNITDLYLKEKGRLDFESAKLGTLAHEVMEKVGNLKLSQALKESTLEIYSRNVVREVKTTLEKLVNHPLILRIERAKSTRSELAIQFHIPELKIDVIGKLDKVMEDEHGWNIVDFKYSYNADEETFPDYEFQMRLYMLAFKELTGIEASGEILFLKSGRRKGIEFNFEREKMISEIKRRMVLLKFSHPHLQT